MATKKRITPRQEAEHLDQGLSIRKLRLSRAAKLQGPPRQARVLVYNLKILCQRNHERQAEVIEKILRGVSLAEQPAAKRWLKRIFKEGITTATHGAERQTAQRLDWLVDYFKLENIDWLWDSNLDKRLGPPINGERVLAAKQTKNWRTAEKLLQLLDGGSCGYLVELIDEIYRSHSPSSSGAWIANGIPQLRCPGCLELAPASEIEKVGMCVNCQDGTTDRREADWIKCKRCYHYQPPTEFHSGICFRCIGVAAVKARDLARHGADDKNDDNV